MKSTGSGRNRIPAILKKGAQLSDPVTGVEFLDEQSDY